MNLELIKGFKNIVISYIGDITRSEIEIDNAIESISKLDKYKAITNEEKEEVKKQIHADFNIFLNRGVGIIAPYEYEKWFLNRKSELDMDYWERYKKYLIEDKGFPLPVVNTMDDVSNELTDLLGDPTSNNFQRRGLIIGDVQSGKTANYSGLICKAADAGYKVIVLLTGTIEKLRNQTQARLDEAFTGMDSDAMIKQKTDVIVGAGKYNPSPKVVCLTSKQSDFNARVANSLGISLDSLSTPILFVIKKNVSILRKLNGWFKLFNTDGISKISESSLLMVDDESDNASINTNDDDRDPTLTNGLIVEMLNMFEKASYVGFTATPFANIFIDPDTDDDMKKQNLFPKNYIYSLEAPSNYIGARNIFPEDSKHNYMLKDINDGEEYYPLNHKKEDVFSELSPSIKDAINTFLLSNVIRDLRGDITTHRSMIVNISRFVNTQKQIYSLINDYLKEIQDSTRLFSKLPPIKALEDSNISYLHNIYEREYSNLGFEWENIQNELYKAIAPIKVLEVNKTTYGDLNYDENETNGLRAIIVGGMSLSRGLTLEGLTVSYFYRNSKMYDTLMQMGRWFGYRKNYDDLCRIWMNDENKEWYSYISEATDELRRDVKRMKELGATPLEFGFRVRNDIDTLLVTARNKMRHTNQITQNVSLSQEVVETPYLFNDKAKNDINIKNIKSMINDIKEKGFSYVKNDSPERYGYRNIPKDIIIKLLKNSLFPSANPKFDSEAIAKFIENYKGNELNNWDIVFVSGRSDSTYEIDDFSFSKVERSYDTVPVDSNKYIRMNKSKTRIGNPSDPKIYITNEDILKIEKKFHEVHGENSNSISSKYYFIDGITRNPLLMIYCVDLINKSDEVYPIDNFEKEPLLGLGLGFPFLSDVKTKYAQYRVNKIFEALGSIEEIGDEE